LPLNETRVGIVEFSTDTHVELSSRSLNSTSLPGIESLFPVWPTGPDTPTCRMASRRAFRRW
jgi:hypothetical protein